MYGFFSSYTLQTVGFPIVSSEAVVILKTGIGVAGVTSKDRKLYVKPSYLYLRVRRFLSGYVLGADFASSRTNYAIPKRSRF